MSISISIGSNPEDIQRLSMTEDLISVICDLLKQGNYSTCISPNSKNNYSEYQLNNLLNWYRDLLAILYNGGSPEDYSELIPVPD